MSERRVPKKAGWWMATWNGEVARPFFVTTTSEGLYGGDEQRHVWASVDHSRWVWGYQLPTPAEWEAMHDAIKAADAIINDYRNAFNATDANTRILRTESMIRTYEDARAKVKIEGEG